LSLNLLLPFAVRSQVVKEATFKVGKTDKNGYILLSKYKKAEMRSMLAEKFKNEGLKVYQTKSKFHNYKAVTWKVTGPERVDIAYKVTGKKNRSKVYFVAAKGLDNYITAGTDAPKAAAISRFLAHLDMDIATVEKSGEPGKYVTDSSANNANASAAKAATTNNKPAQLISSKKVETY
jgi:hypothetical protein